MAGLEVEPHRRVVFGATGGLVSDRQSGCLRRCYLGMGEKDDKPRQRGELWSECASRWVSPLVS